MVNFEWDEDKAASNIKKHGVSFEEAKSVFFDGSALQFFDETHTQLEENRFLMLGMSNEARLVMVCHCERKDGNCIRIISARRATKNEHKFYGGNL